MTTDLLREMKSIVDKGETLDINTRDRLLFGAIINVLDNQKNFEGKVEAKIEKLEKSVQEKLEKLMPVLTFYKIGLYFASAIGLSVISLVWALLTGQVELRFIK